MSRIYDNWERLVAATLKREKFRELALASSRETSFSSSTSARFNPPFNFKFKSAVNHKSGKSYFLTAIVLAGHVVKVSENADSFKHECLEIRSKAEKVALLLLPLMVMDHDLYSQPARCVMNSTENVLRKAISLLLKCQGLKQMFATVTSVSLQEISSNLEHSISNICWLLRHDQYMGVPPIAAAEPVLYNIWELIAILHTGLLEDRCDAVASLVSLDRGSFTYKRLIVKEGCRVQPLLRLVQEGTPEAQENAIKVVTWIVKEHPRLMNNRITSLFMRILEEGPLIKLQGTVAWAVAKLDKILHYEDEYNFVHVLVNLAVKTLPDDSKVHGINGAGGVGGATRESNLDDENNISRSRVSSITIETKDDKIINDYIKAMVTRALCHLAYRSHTDCRIIAESKALMCFAFFLEKGPNTAWYNSARALMEITRVAEHDMKLRISELKPNLPTYVAVADHVLRIIDQAEPEILIPCAKIIGNLEWTFNPEETRMIGPLVKLLGEREASVSREACIALCKFSSSLHRVKLIVNAGGVKLLVQLIYSGDETAQHCALLLLCYIVSNELGIEQLVEAKVLFTLEWASKQDSLIHPEYINMVLQHARIILPNPVG